MACTHVNYREIDPHLPLNHIVVMDHEKVVRHHTDINNWLATDEAQGVCAQTWDAPKVTKIAFTHMETAFAFKMRFG